MSKRLWAAAKLLSVLILAAGALAAAATLALKRFLPPEKVRTLVIEGARKTLNREVRLQGISLSALKGLSIQGLEVSEVPDFRAGSFAAASSFSLRVKLLPLLRKRVVVDSILLDGLRVSVRRGPGGGFNFSDMASSTTAQSPVDGASAGGLPLELAVRRAVVRDGEILYQDALSGERLKVSALQAKLDDFSLTRPFDAEVSLKAEGRLGQRAIAAALSFAGRVDLASGAPDRFAVSVREASCEQAGAPGPFGLGEWSTLADWRGKQPSRSREPR